MGLKILRGGRTTRRRLVWGPPPRSGRPDPQPSDPCGHTGHLVQSDPIARVHRSPCPAARYAHDIPQRCTSAAPDLTTTHPAGSTIRRARTLPPRITPWGILAPRPTHLPLLRHVLLPVCWTRSAECVGIVSDCGAGMAVARMVAAVQPALPLLAGNVAVSAALQPSPSPSHSSYAHATGPIERLSGLRPLSALPAVLSDYRSFWGRSLRHSSPCGSLSGQQRSMPGLTLPRPRSVGPLLPWTIPPSGRRCSRWRSPKPPVTRSA